MCYFRCRHSALLRILRGSPGQQLSKDVCHVEGCAPRDWHLHNQLDVAEPSEQGCNCGHCIRKHDSWPARHGGMQTVCIRRKLRRHMASKKLTLHALKLRPR